VAVRGHEPEGEPGLRALLLLRAAKLECGCPRQGERWGQPIRRLQMHVQVPLASASGVRDARDVQGDPSTATRTPSRAGTGAPRATEIDSLPVPLPRRPERSAQEDYTYADVVDLLPMRPVNGLRALFRHGHHRLGDDPRRQWCMTRHA
jgi:hypothetical protein